MGQTNTVPSKLYSSEFLLEFESYLTDSEAQLETEEHMKIIATTIAKHLISKDPLPESLFNIEFYTQRDRIHSLACKGKLVFKDFIDIVASCSTKLDAMKTLAPLRNCTASFLNFSSALGLPLVGFGFLGLSLLLQEDQTLKMKKYVDQVAKALKQKIDLERLKDALDDLRAKLLAIQDILCQIEMENLEDSDKRALILSLMVPLKEIYHKITMKNSIYQNFSAYTFETVIFFFILHLGVLKIAKNRFGLALDLEQRRAEYPKILETYLRLMSAQRQKLRHKNGSFLINSTMTSIQERVFKTGGDPEDSPIYGRVLKGLSVEDKLTGEVVFCLDCLKSPLARLKCYSLTFDLVYSKDLFYDAYKEKFQECLAWFEKANTESADILYEKLPIDIL